MKKHTQLLSIMIFALCMMIFLVPASAQEDRTAALEQIMEEVNAQYGTQMDLLNDEEISYYEKKFGVTFKNKVDEMTLAEFGAIAERKAIKLSQLNDESLEGQKQSNPAPQVRLPYGYKEMTEADSWSTLSVTITAAYDRGNQNHFLSASNVRVTSLNSDEPFELEEYSYEIGDGGRTLRIEVSGDLVDSTTGKIVRTRATKVVYYSCYAI